MHAPEWARVPLVDLVLEVRGSGENFGSIVASDVELGGECGEWQESVVNSPWFEEAGCVRGKL